MQKNYCWENFFIFETMNDDTIDLFVKRVVLKVNTKHMFG